MDQQERERALTGLHEIATSIQEAETVEAAAEQTVSAAADILDFHMCSIIIQEGEWLVPYAISEDAPPDGARRVRDDQGLAGKTFQNGESQIVDTITEDDETDPAKETYRSGLSVPIGDHGVFQAVSTETEAFDEQDIELAELLVSHTASAIDRIEREAELREQNNRLEEFTSIVSHDLRSPLSVATGRIELVAEDCESPHLSQARHALDRMETLIEELLTLAQQGAVIEERAPVMLGPLARNCWTTIETPRATLDIDPDSAVTADRTRLRQLLENLFRNAVEHGGKNVTVTVGVLPEAEGFYVADDGSGIPETERDEVFEYGYSTAEGGTGLGLRIVEQIADAHGWEIRVTESADGGARFEFHTAGSNPTDAT